MSVASDEAAVRAYLRAIVGSPERKADSEVSTEAEFVRCGARWAQRVGVDRRTLVGLGVPTTVLDSAAIGQPPIEDLIRPHYGRGSFTAAMLAIRAGVSEASVRQTVADDTRVGVLRPSDPIGRAAAWALIRA